MLDLLKLLAVVKHCVSLSDANVIARSTTACLCFPLGTVLVRRIIDAVSAGGKGGYSIRSLKAQVEGIFSQ